MSNENTRGLFGWLRQAEAAAPEATTERELSPVAPAAEPKVSLDPSLLVDEGVIARGGMASVHRAMDVPFGRRVAMKVLDPKYAANPREFERFLDEARLTGRLDHPHIPPVHSMGIDGDGRPYFTMKYVEGRTLADLLQDETFSPGDEAQLFSAMQILLRACEAVSFAHSRGVIHCDLKPRNIMAGAHGSVYVMDWGIARVLDSASASAKFALAAFDPARAGATDPANVLGTLSYMAPEQAMGLHERIDARTDVFSLGGIMYRLLTGRPPFQGETSDELLAQAQACRIVPAQLLGAQRGAPKRLCEIAMKALSADPAARHPTVRALRDDLELYLRGDAEAAAVTWPAGHLIVKEGDEADAAFIVIEGTVVVFRTIDGERVVLRELGPGEVFGETGVFAHSVRTASVEARTSVKIAQVTRSYLEVELERSPWVTRLAKGLATRFSEVSNQAARLQAENEELRATAELARYIAANLDPSDPHRWAPWAPARMVLARHLKIPAGAVVGIVQKLPSVVLDLEEDRVRMR